MKTIRRRGTLKAQVLKLLHRFRDGLTSYEIAALLEKNVVSVSPVFVRLERMGLVTRWGKRDNRTVWRAI